MGKEKPHKLQNGFPKTFFFKKRIPKLFCRGKGNFISKQNLVLTINHLLFLKKVLTFCRQEE